MEIYMIIVEAFKKKERKGEHIMNSIYQKN
jgi:hypothetical protein